MKKIVLTLIAFAAFFLKSNAQNYSCILPEQKTYFINSSGYLEGMRIDSVKSINGNKVFYPFKANRISMPDAMSGGLINRNGASWLGSEIIETQQSFTLFNTYSGDTVFVKNDAILGESWTLYNDSSSISFQATVIGWDTTTISNVIDSVKIIAIKAMQNNNILSGDSLNDFLFELSKNHGLIKLFPFYFFPFYNHEEPSNSSNNDYYFLRMAPQYSLESMKSNLTFNKVDYQPLVNSTVYDYEIGDFVVSQSQTDFADNLYNTRTDTVVSKQIIGNTIKYNFRYYGKYKTYPTGPEGVITHEESGGYSQTLTKDYPLIDTLMPEEANNNYIQFYNPKDEMFCSVSPNYSFLLTPMQGPNFNNFEPTTEMFSYKNGIGQTHYYIFRIFDEYERSRSIIGVSKNGIFCGTADDVLLPEDTLSNTSLHVYPNPTTNNLNIELPDSLQNQTQEIILFNITGRQVGQWQMSAQKIAIDLDMLQQGIYILKIINEDDIITRKIVIRR